MVMVTTVFYPPNNLSVKNIILIGIKVKLKLLIKTLKFKYIAIYLSFYI